MKNKYSLEKTEDGCIIYKEGKEYAIYSVQEIIEAVEHYKENLNYDSIPVPGAGLLGKIASMHMESGDELIAPKKNKKYILK